MAWTPFSAEAVRLDTQVRKLHREGRTSDALELIDAALERAHREGPSNTTYEQFESELEQARADA